MTLIVLSDRTLYADSRMVKNAGTRQQHFYEGQKLFRDKNGYLAVAFSGNVPRPAQVEKPLEDLIYIAKFLVVLDNQPKDAKEERDKITNNIFNMVDAILERLGDDPGNMYCISHKHMWAIDGASKNRDFNILYEESESAYGSGRSGFNLCRINGLSVEDSYAVINKIDITVGTLADKVTMKDLKPIPVDEQEGEE